MIQCQEDDDEFSTLGKFHTVNVENLTKCCFSQFFFTCVKLPINFALCVQLRNTKKCDKIKLLRNELRGSFALKNIYNANSLRNNMFA